MVHQMAFSGNCCSSLKGREKTKGHFCKRVCLTNVPSIRFFFEAIAVQGNICQNHPFVSVARLQNEIAPEKCLIRYEKGFEKRKNRSEKRSETCPKSFLAPLRAAYKYFTCTFLTDASATKIST